jgi:hypothetical protein
MKYRDTEELRSYLDNLLCLIENGELTNSQARVALLAAKITLDTVKVELSAAALGKSFAKVSFSRGEQKTSKIRAV